jgi:transcriptional regulator with XRE-family HTH domain
MGRRAGVSDTERAFRAHFASALRKVVGGQRGAASAAANQLGISRQALSLYLKGKVTPSADVVRRACTVFKLSMNVRGQLVSSATYEHSVDRLRVEALPLQLPLLPEALQNLSNRQLDVQVLRKIGDALELRVIIDFAKRAG